MSKEKVDQTGAEDTKDEGVEQSATEGESKQAGGEGHLSYNEWVEQGNDPKDYKGEHVFQQVGDLMKRIDKMDKAIGRYKENEKRFDQSIKKLAEVTTKQIAQERERVLAELKLKQKAARRNDDHDLADEIAEEIAEVKSQAKKAEADAKDTVDEATERHQEVVRVANEWMQDPENKWYKLQPKTDIEREMKEEADYAFLRALDRGASPEEALETAVRRVKREFPQEFKAKPKSKVSEGGDDNTQGKVNQSQRGKVSIKSIPTEYQSMAKEMSRMNPKAYPTPQAYVDAMVATGVKFD